MNLTRGRRPMLPLQLFLSGLRCCFRSHARPCLQVDDATWREHRSKATGFGFGM